MYNRQASTQFIWLKNPSGNRKREKNDEELAF